MAGLRDVSFLLVDDNFHALTIVETVVKAFGARDILTAPDEKEALSLLTHKRRDIMICDYIFGRFTICDLVRQIRGSSKPDIRFMPVILLTAHTSIGRITTARDAGINLVCQKPISTTALFKRLAAVVDHPVPYVVSAAYTGPDRRRAKAPPYMGDERRLQHTTLVADSSLAG